jgi:hypothetical protein
MLNMLMTGVEVANGLPDTPEKLNWNESVWPILISVEEALLEELVALTSVIVAAPARLGAAARAYNAIAATKETATDLVRIL